MKRMAPTDSAKIAVRDSDARLPLHLPGGFFREGGAGRDQQRLRIRAMFGLREQIGGDEVGARAVVGDHHHFAYPGRKIRRGTGRVLRHQHLGGRHERIAGSEQLVALWNGGGAVGHGGNGLRAADLEDLVHPCLARSHQHRRVRASVAPRRRAHHAHRAGGDVRRARPA